MNNVVQFPQRKKPQAFRDNSRGPIRFENLWPGSYFRIVAEPSRGVYRSKDGRVYQRDLRFFYSTEVTNAEHSIVLMPQDLVMPMIEDKARNRQVPESGKQQAKVA